MRRAVVFMVLLGGAAAAAIACSTFGAASPDTPDAAADAPAADAPPPDPPPPPPADAASDGTVFFDDFESGDCALYEGFVANIVVTDIAHSGKHACMICRTSDGGRPQASRDFDTPTAPGTYTLSYQAKLADAGSRVAIASFVLSHGADPTASEEFDGPVATVTATSWMTVEHVGTTMSPVTTGGRAVLLGDTTSPVGECLVFDEVRMTYTP